MGQVSFSEKSPKEPSTWRHFGEMSAPLFPRSEVRPFRLEASDLTRCTDDGAKLSKRTDFPRSPCLEQDIAEDRGLNRTGQHWPLAGVGRELVEQVIARTTTDDMDHLNALTANLFE